jgi:hypothetical protein
MLLARRRVAAEPIPGIAPEVAGGEPRPAEA